VFSFGVRRQSEAATALWIVWGSAFRRYALIDGRVNAELRTKAPSPLRSAGALQIQILMMTFFRYNNHIRKSQSRIKEIAKASDALFGASQEAYP